MVIESEAFDSTPRSASLNIKSSGTKLKQAFVIYLPKIGSTPTKHRSNPKPVSETAPQIGVKIAINIESDASSIKAIIPASVEAYRFMLIDQNNYIVYSEPKAAK